MLAAILALGMTIASVTREWAMPAAERAPVAVVNAAFAALGLAPAVPAKPVPAKPVTVAVLPAVPSNDAVPRPRVEDKCDDFSFAFFSTTCVKFHKRHTTLRRRAVTATFKPAAPPRPQAANEGAPTSMRLAEDAKTSQPNKPSVTVR